MHLLFLEENVVKLKRNISTDVYMFLFDYLDGIIKERLTMNNVVEREKAWMISLSVRFDYKSV